MSGALSQLAGPTSMNTGGGPMPYPAPIGPVGGNALIDWIGAATNFPSFPNPYTAGNFLQGFFPQQNNSGGQNPTPRSDLPPWLKGAPSGITSGGSGASAPTANAQSPLSPVSTPQGMGKPAPTLPNPDIGTFGTGPKMGPDMDKHGTMSPFGTGMGGGPMSGRGIPMPRMGAGPGGK